MNISTNAWKITPTTSEAKNKESNIKRNKILNISFTYVFVNVVSVVFFKFIQFLAHFNVISKNTRLINSYSYSSIILFGMILFVATFLLTRPISNLISYDAKDERPTLFINSAIILTLVLNAWFLYTIILPLFKYIRFVNAICLVGISCTMVVCLILDEYVFNISTYMRKGMKFFLEAVQELKQVEFPSIAQLVTYCIIVILIIAMWRFLQYYTDLGISKFLLFILNK